MSAGLLPTTFYSTHTTGRSERSKSASFSAYGNRYCQYIGSFVVAAESDVSEKARTDFVRAQLIGLRRFTRSKPVLLIISLSGIKMCTLDGKVYMAHALKRISYATCDPEQCQFAFLAREPKHIQDKPTVQYCHVFKTDSIEQAEEINSIVGNAFRAAYACKLNITSSHRHPPEGSSFSDEPIERQRRTPSRTKSGRDSVETPATSSGSRPSSSQDDSMEEGNSVTRPQSAKLRVSDSPGNNNNQPSVPPRSGRVPLSPVIKVCPEQNQKLATSTPNVNEDQVFAIPRLPPRRFADRPRPASMMVLPGVKNSSPPFSEESSLESEENLKLLKRRCESKGSMRGAIFRKLFGNKDKTRSTTDLNQNEKMSQSVVFRPNKAKKRRPVSELFANTFKIGSPTNQPTQTSKQSQNGSVQSSPGLGSKSISVSATKNKNRFAKDKSLRQSANLEHIYRAQDRLDRTSSVPPNNPQSLNQKSPNQLSSPGIGCGTHCDMSTTSPDMLKPQNSDYLLAISERDEYDLQQVPWYCGDIDRQIVIDVLWERPEGAFVVRKSASQRFCLALSVHVPESHNPRKVSHYLVLKTSRGFKLKGFTKDFPSVQALVTHHSVMQEQLPCRLKFVNWDPEIWTKHRPPTDPNANQQEAIYGAVG